MTDQPSPSELLQRAIDMQPMLRERASANSEARQISPETMEAFHDAGFFKIIQPAAFGGYEMNPKHFYDVVFEVARACPASGWVLSVVGVHSYELGLMDPQAQQDVWGENNRALISSSYAPKSKVEIVEGGYKVSGKWGFSSGSDHCQWFFGGGIVPDQEPITITAFMFPRSDYQIIDDWHVTGLQGSGSKSILVEDAFVPFHRTHSMLDGFLCQGKGQAINKNDIFKLPFGQVFGRAVSMPSVGATQGALDAYREYNTNRYSAGIQKVSDNPAAQIAGSEAASVIRTYRLKMHYAYDTLLGYIARDEEMPAELRSEFRSDQTRAVGDCMTVVQNLLNNSGGSALYEGNTVNSIFQDMQAFRQHAANQSDATVKNHGSTLFGVENMDTMS